MTVAESTFHIIKLSPHFFKCVQEYEDNFKQNCPGTYSDKIKEACCHCSLRYKCLDGDQRCLEANRFLQVHFDCMGPEKHGMLRNISIDKRWLDSSILDLMNECESGNNAAKEVKDGRLKD